MRIAIIGKTGQLARALIREAESQNLNAVSFDRSACDLTHSQKTIENFIETLNVDAVIIAAAYTAVDAAEDDYDTAFAANGLAPMAIATACARKNIALVHISTDYVFQGEANSPYEISAPTDPVNAYGRSKLAGEQAVLDNHDRAAVLRTSWVFDGTGKNFMTTMLRLGSTRDTLTVVSDQIGRPTYAAHLAQACLTVADALCQPDYQHAAGLYHVSGSGAPISWADFANAIFTKAQSKLGHTVTVTPIPSKDYPTPAKRPGYSVLDLTRFETLHGTLPDWNEGLELAFREWDKTKL